MTNHCQTNHSCAMNDNNTNTNQINKRRAKISEVKAKRLKTKSAKESQIEAQAKDFKRLVTKNKTQVCFCIVFADCQDDLTTYEKIISTQAKEKQKDEGDVQAILQKEEKMNLCTSSKQQTEKYGSH